jgi:transcriptional regulator with XRE-family HTH domain
VADIEPFYKDLGKRIQEARDRAGLTQQEVADRLIPKVTRASIANMESGKQRVLCHTLVALSAVLSTRPEELLPPSGAPRSVEELEAQGGPFRELELELTRKIGKRATTNILTKLDRGGA